MKFKNYFSYFNHKKNGKFSLYKSKETRRQST